MAIRIAHFGLGPIGCAIVRQVLVRKGFAIAAAIDIDPAKAGRDLGDVVGLKSLVPRQYRVRKHSF